jgi:activator of HSP90 ATPase
MSIEFEVSDLIPAHPDEIYNAWLDPEIHSEMTGGKAEVSSKEGDSFTAWDGYIQGKNTELRFPNRILQSWRTVEFDGDDEDSRLEILFEAAGSGTKILIRHSNLPDHGMQYKQGWFDSYFIPMKAYFSGK